MVHPVIDGTGDKRREHALRRLTIAMLAATGIGWLGSPASQAQAPNYPWCIVYSGGQADGGEHCMFTSYAQCMLTATPGSGASCVHNPRDEWRRR